MDLAASTWGVEGDGSAVEVDGASHPHVGGRVAPKGEDGAGGAGSEFGEPAAVGGQDGGGAVRQGGEEFGLGFDDGLDGAEEANVRAGNAGDDGSVRHGHAAVGGDLAADLGAHLDHGETVVGKQAGERGGDSYIGVLAAIGGQGEAVSAESGRQRLLGGGLAVAAGDADDSGGTALPDATGEFLEGGECV